MPSIWQYVFEKTSNAVLPSKIFSSLNSAVCVVKTPIFISPSLSKLFIVCPLLESEFQNGTYTVLWYPSSVFAHRVPERVQCKFLRYVSFALEIPCSPHCYTPVSMVLSPCSLPDRRHRGASLIFRCKSYLWKDGLSFLTVPLYLGRPRAR